MQPWARSFYRSRAWQECRAALVADRCGLCEQCGGPGLIVHHRVRLTPANIGNPAVTLDWANLQLLCIECHNRAHGGNSVSDGLSFDASGNLIRRPLDIRIVWGSPASGKSRLPTGEGGAPGAGRQARHRSARPHGYQPGGVRASGDG